MNADNISTFSFVFDMNALFEEYVGEMIRRSCHDRFTYITMQRPCRNLVESKIVNGEDVGQVFNMKPDIALGQNYKYPEIIVDTKYKMLENDSKKEGVSQADMYQMNAYSKKYNCSNIILLYPRNSAAENRLVDFHIDSRTIVKIRSIDLCRDLKRDKLLMFQELRSILEI
jgi:5-methylcytosine-specific restriction enzyme subunit McrC